MTDAPVHPALFTGLIRDEAGEPVETVMVGNTPCYVVLDDGFRRHIEAETVDRQVLAMLRDQFLEHKEIATEAMLQMLHKDDLFTKAMIDASVKNMDQVIERGLPDEAQGMQDNIIEHIFCLMMIPSERECRLIIIYAYITKNYVSTVLRKSAHTLFLLFLFNCLV